MSAIEGKVINQRDLQGIEGAKLKASEGSVSREISSGKGGVFIIDSLNAGQYELTVTKEGFEEGIYGPVTVFNDFPTKLNLALQPKVV